MISPEQIKRQALKWWVPFLQSHIGNESFFPKQIDRIGKIRPGQVTGHFETLQKEVELLYRYSKNETGAGYLVNTAERHFHRTGSHVLPDSVVFETPEDYLRFTGKKKEWEAFQRNYQLISTTIPLLKEWALNHTGWLTAPAKNWQDILKICRYFIATPRPNLYLRQLPVEVHTKFVEDNAIVIQSLLDFLIPGHIRDRTRKRFAERFFLKYDEPLIRIRILDRKQGKYADLTDLSIPLSDFERTSWDFENVLIAENKMNFLTLPDIPSAIAIWSGGGFSISYLRNTAWLEAKHIYYWGDLDEHGFQILQQIRSYFHQVQSLMMDEKTFNTFLQFAVDGARNHIDNLAGLNAAEAALYARIKSLQSKNRLEQEKIPQDYVITALSRIS